MKLHFYEEPQLEFGTGTHICPRAGIRDFDVYDVRIKARRDRILVGAVGTSDTLSKLHEWLSRCAGVISAKESNQPNLFVEFCGFNRDVGFRATILIDDGITRPLSNSE